VLQQLALGHHLPGPPHQVLQQGELPGGQLDVGLRAPDPPGRRVQGQVTRPELCGPGDRAAPEQRPQPGGQDHVRERLGQVVVGAQIQAVRLVVLAVLSGQDEDRYPVLLGAQLLADPVPGDLGQHQVQYHGVIPALAGGVQAVLPVMGQVDREALGGQTAPDSGGQPSFVFHDEHPHGPEGTRNSLSACLRSSRDPGKPAAATRSGLAARAR
jgi:hypothetical protein